MIEAIERYLRYLKVERNASDLTIKSYREDLLVWAQFLAEHGQPALYRIHDGPPPEKLATLREFLNGFALTLTGGEEPTGGISEVAIQLGTPEL